MRDGGAIGPRGVSLLPLTLCPRIPRRAVKIAHLGALQNRTLPGGQFEIAHLM